MVVCRSIMAKTSSTIALVVGLVVMILIALVGGAKAVPICKVDSTELGQCLPAIRGPPTPPPTRGCCAAMQKADLHCLCFYKSLLPSLGISPALATALPKKCGLTPPPECGKA